MKIEEINNYYIGIPKNVTVKKVGSVTLIDR